MSQSSSTDKNKYLDKITKFNDFIQPYFQRIIYLRLPVTVALISFLIFTTVEQTIEVYRYVALDGNTFQAFVSTLFVFVFSLVVWYSARLLELELEQKLEGPNESSHEQNESSHEQNESSHEQNELSLTFLPEFFGFLPIAAVTIAIFQVNSSLDNTFLATWFWGCVIGGLIYQIVVVLPVLISFFSF